MFLTLNMKSGVMCGNCGITKDGKPSDWTRAVRGSRSSFDVTYSRDKPKDGSNEDFMNLCPPCMCKRSSGC